MYSSYNEAPEKQWNVRGISFQYYVETEYVSCRHFIVDEMREFLLMGFMLIMISGSCLRVWQFVVSKRLIIRCYRSALQTLHKVSSKAREQNYFLGGLTHDWVSYYEQRIESDRSCLNEWHAMDSLESRRPPSPDSVRTK
jgi:hypothetical protein